MLRINLATRPFYNERIVHLVMLSVGLFALIVMGFSTVKVVRLNSEYRFLVAASVRDEVSAKEKRGQVASTWGETKESDLLALAASASKVNTLISQRVFSWTEFFSHIEATLPVDVMLESIRPEIGERGVSVSLGVIGRGVDEIDAFVEELEKSGAFKEILAREQEITVDGSYRALLIGLYLPKPESTQIVENSSK